jgi:hypothetical protein
MYMYSILGMRDNPVAVVPAVASTLGRRNFRVEGKDLDAPGTYLSCAFY